MTNIVIFLYFEKRPNEPLKVSFEMTFKQIVRTKYPTKESMRLMRHYEENDKKINFNRISILI